MNNNKMNNQNVNNTMNKSQHEQHEQTQQHELVGKETGQTNHMERWNNTIRQWVGRLTRKTLSFSKTDFDNKFIPRISSYPNRIRVKT